MTVPILAKTPGTPLYVEVAERIAALVEQQTFRPGDRVPSIRSLSRQLQVSINTVKEAYGLLEDRRVIEARPQSGYYVCSRLPELPRDPRIEAREIEPTGVSIAELADRVMRDSERADLVQFGCAIPNPELLPVARIGRMLAQEVRRHAQEHVAYSMPPGCARLRTEIAKRLLVSGCTVRPGEILTTTGCSEAVFLALQALCRPGDTVVVESPVYFNFLQQIQALGLRALEIPATQKEGMSLEALRYALDHNRVRVCLAIPNFHNPLGSCMPEERKRELVALLAERGIPLIEDDIHGDLGFGSERPRAAKAWDRDGNVILCSSFSKTVAPGYRVGWMVPGRYQAQIERLKMVTNIASPAPTQLALAALLANGGYDQHLRRIRRIYARQVAGMAEAIGRHFPAETRVTRPEGGNLLWVEMPEGIDALRLYARAMRHGMTFAPGPLFSAAGRFRNCLRLNAAFWTPELEGTLATLGRLAGEMQGDRAS
ncbi:MAG: PLP-dependent aminotransferase family protein [Deltaproteobacteria bacterium]|nr:MAG: PLP-dependent aminotransferase family protein [Deltaproteobacteria bacterium]